MTKSMLAALGLSVAAIATPALAQDALPVRIFPNIADTGPTTTTSTPEFRAEALRSDAASIEASRMALERSRNPRVRSYARNVLETREATTKALLPPPHLAEPRRHGRLGQPGHPHRPQQSGRRAVRSRDAGG